MREIIPVTTRFPRWISPEQLGAAARNWAERHYGHRPRGNVDRITVNMLRHVYTDYDRAPTCARRAEANAAIAKRFPFLAVEAQRQNAERAAERAEGTRPGYRSESHGYAMAA